MNQSAGVLAVVEQQRGRARPKPAIGSPRSRLGIALRKLEDALASDSRELVVRAREFVRRFHSYSPQNRILLFLQRPDASFVQGKRQWRAQGREVKKGARAIHLLAPRHLPGEGGTARSFVSVKVFDLSDTTGPDFVVPSAAKVRGNEELISERLRQLEQWVTSSGLELRFDLPPVNSLIDGATNGQTIWIRPTLPEPARLGVLAHEIAHVKLHFPRRRRGTELLVDRSEWAGARDLRELQAELTGYLLLEFSGIDSSLGAAAYLNCWRASPAEVRANSRRCLAVACSVLRACETGRYKLLVRGPPEIAERQARGAPH